MLFTRCKYLAVHHLLWNCAEPGFLKFPPREGVTYRMGEDQHGSKENSGGADTENHQVEGDVARAKTFAGHQAAEE
jgi:hypothetical protein